MIIYSDVMFYDVKQALISETSWIQQDKFCVTLR
jgi:hypothetical protein